MPLDQPPLDGNGEVVPHDHHQIHAGDGIIRRISHHHLVEDEKAQGKRVSSAAFSPSSGANGGMSVDLQASIEAAGLNAAHYVISPPFLGAVRFEARELRGEGMMVGYDPLPENPHHGEVWGNFSKQKKKRLQALAQMFVQPKEEP